MKRASHNIQSFPRTLKHLWIAPKGYKIVWGDWSQIEAKLVAFFARDEERTRIVLAGGDLYAYAAQALYGCEPTKAAAKAKRVPFGGELRPARDAAKTFDLAWGYGMGPRTFADKHGIPEKEATRLIKVSNERWPAIATWRREVVWQAFTQKWLETPFGWRRYFWTPFSGTESSIEKWGDAREALSHLPQSTAASIFKRTLAKLGGDSSGYSVWAARHDEIALLVQESCAEDEARKLKTLMEQSWPQLEWNDMYPAGFHCGAEIVIGQAWGKVEVTI